jgi:rod shape-determining protein MreC
MHRNSRVFVRFAPMLDLGGRGTTYALMFMASRLLLVSFARPQTAEGLRTSATDLFLPVFAAISQPFQTAVDVISDVSGVAQMRAEIAQLQSENIRLREWYQTALLLQSENQSLQALLNLKTEPQHRFVTTRVVSDSGSAYVKSLVIAAGQNDRVQKDHAVLAENGMIGRIIEAGRNSSRVLLITDMNSRVPILIEGSRQKAIMTGTNETLPMLMHLPPDTVIEPGARVITSGHGGIFPPGLPVGRIERTDGGEYFVRPFADMNRVTYVRVLDSSQNPHLRRGLLD